MGRCYESMTVSRGDCEMYNDMAMNQEFDDCAGDVSTVGIWACFFRPEAVVLVEDSQGFIYCYADQTQEEWDDFADYLNGCEGE